MATGNVVRFGGTFDTKQVEAGIKRVDAGMATLHKSAAGLGTGLKIGAAIGAVAITGFATQVAAGIKTLIDLEDVTAQTNAAIKSTGGAAGVTGTQVRALAEKFEGLNATMDDKVIQSAENMLLTFTSIKKDAFEPAIATILDMNQAMGGGPEGLQGTVIQVGKALQDPINGITALRKVGVNFSDDQRKVIESMVETGDVLGAQKLILKELNTEFGGSFKAAGNTTRGTFAKIKDSVEDAQAALATGFLPVVKRVADVLETRLSDPAVTASLEDVGNRIAGLFTDQNIAKGEEFATKVWGALGDVPWDSIGSGLQIAGAASKTAIDAFMRLPANVQGGLIGLLAANKLTGGAVSAGIGDLAGFVLKSVGSKIFAANVTVVGANVVGGGAGAVPNLLPAAGAAAGAAEGAAALGFGAIGAGIVGGVVLSSASLLALGKVVEATSTPAQLEANRVAFNSQEVLKHTGHTLEEIRGKTRDVDDSIESGVSRLYDKLEESRQAILSTGAQIVSAVGTPTVNPYTGFNTTPSTSSTGSIVVNPYTGFHASGMVGMFDRPTGAIFGEAGQEAVAILRNPRRGVFGGQAMQPVFVNNTYINISGRHVEKDRRRANVWNQFVAQ